MSAEHSHNNAMAASTCAAGLANELLEERENHAQAISVLKKIVEWMESDDGPLVDEFEKGYIGRYENIGLDWPTTLANIRKGLKVWGDTSVKESPVADMYYAARLMVNMHAAEVQNREDAREARNKGKAHYCCECVKCGQKDRTKLYVVIEGHDKDGAELDALWCEECAIKNRYCTCCGYHEQEGNEIEEDSGGLCKQCVQDEYDAKMQDKAEDSP